MISFWKIIRSSNFPLMPAQLSPDNLSFLSRQLITLREISGECLRQPPALTADRLADCVHLIERVLPCCIDACLDEQLHDYITDFYEEKIRNLRMELHSAKANRVSSVPPQSPKSNDLKPLFASYELQRELADAQRRLADNQKFIAEQNSLIDCLDGQVMRLEKESKAVRLAHQKRVVEFDDYVSSRHKDYARKELDVERKRLHRELSELEVSHASLTEERESLERELLVKEEECRVFSRKIYEQSAVISQYERRLSEQEGLATYDKLNQLDGQQCYTALKDRVTLIDKEYATVLAMREQAISSLQLQLQQISREKRDLQDKLQTSEQQVRRMKQKWSLSEKECGQLSQNCNQQIRQRKKATQKIQQLLEQKADMLGKANGYQEALEKEREVGRKCREEIVAMQRAFTEEKKAIQEDIQAEISELGTIHKELLTQMKKLQAEAETAAEEKEELIRKNHNLCEALESTTAAFESSKASLDRIQAQKYALEQKIHLQDNVATKQARLQPCLNQMQLERDRLQAQCKELREVNEQLLKQIDSDKVKGVTEREEEVRLLRSKQEVWKGETVRHQFMVRQLQNKINVLQEEMRETEKRSQLEKSAMQNKMRELEDIIQQRFQFSSKHSSSDL